MSPAVPFCTRVSARMKPSLGPPRFVREHVWCDMQSLWDGLSRVMARHEANDDIQRTAKPAGQPQLHTEGFISIPKLSQPA